MVRLSFISHNPTMTKKFKIPNGSFKCLTYYGHTDLKYKISPSIKNIKYLVGTYCLIENYEKQHLLETTQ